MDTANDFAETGGIMKRQALLLAAAACALAVGCGSSPMASSSDATVSPGVWGGMNAELTVTATAAHLKLVCGTMGEVTSPLRLDAVNHFDVAGTLQRVGAPLEAAHYSGIITDGHMAFTMLQVGTGLPALFNLTLGEPGRMDVCSKGR